MTWRAPDGPTPEWDVYAWELHESWRSYDHSEDMPEESFDLQGEDRDYWLVEWNDQNARQQHEAVAKGLALDNPNLDFFIKYTPRQPKLEIGAYVLSHGFNVPLIRSPEEWRTALE